MASCLLAVDIKYCDPANNVRDGNSWPVVLTFAMQTAFRVIEWILVVVLAENNPLIWHKYSSSTLFSINLRSLLLAGT